MTNLERISVIERVHTITDFHDRPRSGIADFRGEAHWFECEWDEEADDYAAGYSLSPVSEEIFRLEVERYEIFLRWQRASRAGGIVTSADGAAAWKAVLKDFPALPHERVRFDELSARVEGKLCIDPLKRIRASADFRQEGVVWRPL